MHGEYNRMHKKLLPTYDLNPGPPAREEISASFTNFQLFVVF